MEKTVGRIDVIDEEQLAFKFHETYERLAPSFGYETKAESAVRWPDVPENNRGLMIATAREVLEWLKEEATDEPEPEPVDPWWPEEMKCQHCSETIEIKSEPEKYVMDCPHCGDMVMVEPVKKKQ